MALTARIERLEKEVRKLHRAVSKQATTSPTSDRELARRLVIRELRAHRRIDGFQLAVQHGLNFGYVEEALQELERLGAVSSVDE